LSFVAGTNIGDGLRAIREWRGWSRETLAHHAGMSWGAIAQIESGRRPNPRVSTMIALAAALGVTVEQLGGQATPAGSPPDLLQHRVLLYATDAEFVDATVPFLTAGIERGEAVMAVTVPSRITRLRRALGADAKRVVFEESSGWYTSPQAALDGYRGVVDESVRAGHPWVRILGEPVWADRSAREIRAWTRYESMLNLIFGASPATVMCPYSTSAVPEHIAADALCTHPEVVTGAGAVASAGYRRPEAFLLEG
jgi:transcriptional regulator with XRE-family HTH domain